MADSNHSSAPVGDTPSLVGKYLISPLSRRLHDGTFASSVSIRSGSGQGTTDRVVRFTQLFKERSAALAYARAEGLQWIGAGPAVALHT